MRKNNGYWSLQVHVIVFMLICSASVALQATTEGSAQSILNRKLLIGKYAGKGNSEQYAVIFDGGSTGTRAHVFRFDSSTLELLPIGQEFEFNKKTTPGLSSYEDNPKGAAESLQSLLKEAEALVPTAMQPYTPVKLGATAGLRLLSGDAAERILEAVRELFANGSNLKYKAEWVSIIDGFQEGSYMWVAVNYLLGNLGKSYPKTVGVVDLGGASVQMAYAISEESAANAPSSVSADDKYLAEWNLKGTKYYLYTHSYLKYGLEAFRAEMLKLSGKNGNPCVTNGYKGRYTYSGVVYNVSTPPSGNSIPRCRALIRKALNLHASCPHQNCTFNGIWNGGGGAGQENLYVATNYYYTAAAANLVDQSITSKKICPIKYLKGANVACNTYVDDMKTVFPHVRDDTVPFLCMDLLYEYTLLVNGFGIKPKKEVTVVQNFVYKGSEFEAAWPLGAALDLLSPPQLKLSLYHAS